MVFQWEMFNVGESDRGSMGLGWGYDALYYHTEIKISKESNVGKKERHIPPRRSHTPQSPHPHLPNPSTQQTAPPQSHPIPPPTNPQTNPKQTNKTSTKKPKHGQNKKGTQSPPH